MKAKQSTSTAMSLQRKLRIVASMGYRLQRQVEFAQAQFRRNAMATDSRSYADFERLTAFAEGLIKLMLETMDFSDDEIFIIDEIKKKSEKKKSRTIDVTLTTKALEHAAKKMFPGCRGYFGGMA